MARAAGTTTGGGAQRLFALTAVLVLAASWLLATAPPASAACHIAGFVETEASGAPGTTVTLTVELQGRVDSCAGTVDVTTVDGTAVAGEDYEAVTETLTFEEGDDRVEDVEVVLLDGAASGTSFTLELSSPTGGISGTGGPATVTVEAGDPADGDTAGDDSVDEAAGEDVDPAAADDDAADESAEDDDDGGSSVAIVVAVVIALAVGIGAFVLLRGRG